MLKSQIALALVLATAAVGPTFAQATIAPTPAIEAAPAATNAPRFAEIDADRINATQVTLDIEYVNGGCDQIGVPQLGALNNGVLDVQLAVSGAKPNCTTQNDEGDITYTIEAADTVTQLNVTLTNADGMVLGSETVNIDR